VSLLGFLVVHKLFLCTMHCTFLKFRDNKFMITIQWRHWYSCTRKFSNKKIHKLQTMMIENRLKSMTYFPKFFFRFPLTIPCILLDTYFTIFTTTQIPAETPSQNTREKSMTTINIFHIRVKYGRKFKKWICWFFWLIKSMIYCIIISDDKCRLDLVFLKLFKRLREM
jgi:hypothetical protein